MRVFQILSIACHHLHCIISSFYNLKNTKQKIPKTADGILFDIAGEIIKKLGSRALDEIGLWWGVKDELRKLEATVSSIHNVLLDAEEQQKHNHQVKGWLEKLQEVVYDADDLLDDFATEALRRQAITGNRMAKEVSLFFSSSNRLVYGFKMGHKIKAIRERLHEIDADKQSFKLEVHKEERGYTTKVRDQTESSVPEVVIGREGDKKAILELLLASNSKENVSYLSIVGIGELGKTTLAQLIFNYEQVSKHFEVKLWVCVSDPFDVKMIVKKILESAKGTKSEELELEALKSHLGKIINGKKYMLVLDDVWDDNSEKWDKLKKLLREGSSGSKILVTTRSRKVAEVASTVEPYVLEGLSTNESWSLFLHVALKGQEPKDSRTKKTGEEIVNKCARVPLAIKTIASILRFKNSGTEWEVFLQKELSKKAQNEDDILPTLQLSYDHLPSHLKHCFAYCALFPKDHVVNVETLIHLWVVQGFIKSPNSSLCVEDIGLDCFMELWWRSFFQEVERDKFGNIKSCKMHDLMHDLATSVAGTISIINSKEKCVDERARRVSFDFNLRDSHEILAGMCIAKKLKPFLLPRPDGYIESIADFIFSSFRRLRACDMKNLQIEKLPSSIKSLKHFRYLNVSDNWKIKALPNSITDLQNLQVLNVSDCPSLVELPKDIKMLINLRHLCCDHCYSLTHMPRGLALLTSLQTLSIFMVARDSSTSKNAGGLNELSRLNNLRGILEIYFWGFVKDQIINPNLKDKPLLQSLLLDSVREDDYQNVESEEMKLQNLQPHPNLKKLTVWRYGGRSFPSWLSSLTNLINISLYKCSKCQHLPPMHQIPSLLSLVIRDFRNLEYMEIEVEGTTFFPSLKSLELQQCPKLKGWRKTRDDSTTDLLQFPCLSQFRCYDCPILTWIPHFPSLDDSLHLENVSAPLAHQIFTTSISSSSSSIVPPLSKLKKLAIGGYPSLISLPQEMRSLTSLQELIIYRCPLLGEGCGNKKEVDWPFISHIPNIRLMAKKSKAKAAI